MNHRSHGGFTATHIAVENDDIGVLEQLKAAGADLRIKTTGGKSPWDMAAEGGRETAKRWLEANGRTK